MQVILPPIELDQGQVEKEAQKQLGGIKILLWVGIVISLIAVGESFNEIIRNSFNISRIFYSILSFICSGGILFLNVFSFSKIGERKSYSVPLMRTILILWCFTIVGIIFALILFLRINHPAVKAYLNYFDGSFQVLNNPNVKKDIKQEIISLNKYCHNCGKKNLKEDIFCKYCGTRLINIKI